MKAKEKTTQRALPQRTLTDTAIAEIYGESDAKAKEDDNKKVHTSITLTKKLRDLCDKEAKEYGMTYNAYVVSLITADLRRKGYI